MRYLHLGRMAVKPSCEPENNFPRSKVGRPRAKFDVAEAYALRQQGWSLNALGDKFNVDATTIRSHLRGYEPPPKPPAPPPRRWSVGEIGKQDGVRYRITAVDETGKPTAAARVEEPAPVPVVLQPVQQSTQVVQPASAPVDEGPAPEPIHNADSLGVWWMDRGVLNFKPDDAQVFLVHQPEIVEYAGQRGQFAIAIPRWHSAYDTLFASVPSIWVAITWGDGAWLKSLLTASPEIRAKMRLFVGDLQTLFTLKRDTDLAIIHRQNVRVDGFYEAQFKPIPQDAAQIEALLQPPKLQPTRTVWEIDWRIGGSAGSSGHSGGRIEVPSSGSDPNGSGHGNDGSGMCF